MRKILMAMVLMYANLFAFQTKTIQYKGKKLKIVSGEIVVVIDTSLYTFQELRNTFHSMGYWVIDSVPQLKAYLLRIPSTKDESTSIGEISWFPFIKRAEFNYVTHTLFVPDDPMYGSQWGLHKIHAEDAWNISKGSSTIKMGIMDSGLPMSDGHIVDHPDIHNRDIAGKVWLNRYIPGKDFTDEGDNTIQDIGGHGTHVTGIATARLTLKIV